MVSLGQEDFIEGARAVKRCHQATRDSRRFRNGAVSISMEAVQWLANDELSESEPRTIVARHSQEAEHARPSLAAQD